MHYCTWKKQQRNLSQKLYYWTIICVTIRLHGEICSNFFMGRIKSVFVRYILETAISCCGLPPDRQQSPQCTQVQQSCIGYIDQGLWMWRNWQGSGSCGNVNLVGFKQLRNNYSQFSFKNTGRWKIPMVCATILTLYPTHKQISHLAETRINHKQMKLTEL